MYEGKEVMQDKDYTKAYGAKTATTIHLTQPCHGTGRRVIADSWFVSVKYASELCKTGLYSIMLVKTAHKDYLCMLLGESDLERGQWVSYSTDTA